VKDNINKMWEKVIVRAISLTKKKAQLSYKTYLLLIVGTSHCHVSCERKNIVPVTTVEVIAKFFYLLSTHRI
jgi:hypothetical protein